MVVVADLVHDEPLQFVDFNIYLTLYTHEYNVIRCLVMLFVCYIYVSNDNGQAYLGKRHRKFLCEYGILAVPSIHLMVLT